MQPFGLAIGTVSSADVGTLVPVETEPAEIVEDRRFRVSRRSLCVGVLNPEDERRIPLTAGEEPVEQRRACIADVKVPGRTGCEANTHAIVNLELMPIPGFVISATPPPAPRPPRRGRSHQRLRW